MRKDFFAMRVKSMLIIAPEKSLIKKVVDALNLIKKVDLEEYKNSFSRINVIFVTRVNSFSGPIFLEEKCWFDTKSAMSKQSLNWLASIIIHEGCHVNQYNQYKDGKCMLLSTKVKEGAAIESQAKFLRKLGDDWEANWLQQYFKKECKRKDPWWVRGRKQKIANAHFDKMLKLLMENKLELTFI